MIVLSVIVCTHNPREHYISRVLDALRNQSLDLAKWELIIVDNLSDPPLSGRIDLNWHPSSQLVREEAAGLTHARLRGIGQAVADLLVFVDDDNVLQPDYLETALDISVKYPWLGAWGGGLVSEFEVNPPLWTKRYWSLLGLREVKRDAWSNLLNHFETTPIGAGMSVRALVARHYAKAVRNDPLRLSMDRSGNSLMSGGDIDLAYTACDLGFGTGVFKGLRLTHLIPALRLEKDHLLRLQEWNLASDVVLRAFRGEYPATPKKQGILKRIFQSYCNRLQPRIKREFMAAQTRGYQRGADILRKAGSVSDKSSDTL